MRALLLLLACLPLLQAQDASKEIRVSIEVDSSALPGMVHAEYPGLPLAAIQALLQKQYEPRGAAYTTTVTMAVPPAVRTAQPSFMPLDPNPKPVEAVRVSSGVMKGVMAKTVPPVYPPVAKARGIQGKVVLSATIGKHGQVADLRGIEGHLLLMEAAHEAVSQWEYRPFILSDQPVVVITEVEVTFALN
jgi:TonB family protein